VTEEEPLLGRLEAAALLAVDAANGGELSGIEQVFRAYEMLFRRRPEVPQVSRSFALLCEAGLVEYADSELGLTSRGRKLLRRAGLPSSPDRPNKVTDLLGELEESDLVPEGSVPVPAESDIADSLADLESDDAAGEPMEIGANIACPPVGVPLDIWAR
jgi:hypothetical protein